MTRRPSAHWITGATSLAVRTIAIVLCAGLAGCGAIRALFEDETILPCPEYSIPADAASMVVFRPGPGRDHIDVNYLGKIRIAGFKCEYTIDRDTGAGTMVVEILVVVGAERGPVNRDREAGYEYFISVTDQEKRILYREALKLDVRFPSNVTRITVPTEPVSLEIPVKAGQDGRDFLVYSGFILTREQLEYNRTRRREQLR